MKNSKGLLLVLVSALLLLGVGTVSALDARIAWDPNPLVIDSLSPGDEATYSVTLTNTGSLPIPAAYQLRIEAEGGIVQYLTIEQPEFPRIFKRGQEVTFSVYVSLPDNAPTGTIEGTLALKRVIGKRVLDVWQAEGLPVTITVVEAYPDTLPYSVAADPEMVVGDPDGGVYPVNQIFFRLVEGATRDDAEDIARSVSGQVIGFLPLTSRYQLQLSTATIPELTNVIDRLRSDPRVAGAFRNTLALPQNALPTTDLDNLFSQEPSLIAAYDVIRIRQAWQRINDTSPPTRRILVGVQDTGASGMHPEFVGVPGVSLDDEPSPVPPSFEACKPTAVAAYRSHGTSVAGIIGAGNLAAMASIFPDSPEMNGILSGFLGNEYLLNIGYLNGTDIASLFGDDPAEWPNVVNLSFGSLRCSADEPRDECRFCIPADDFEARKDDYAAVFLAYKDHTLFVAAAGNDNADAGENLPGGIEAENVLTVGATNLVDQRTDFTNHGQSVDIAAPGVQVYAPVVFDETLEPATVSHYASPFNVNSPYITCEGGYFCGTSASAPLVSGIAAMVMAIDPLQRPPKDVKELLMRTAAPVQPLPLMSVPKLGCPETSEYGCRVDAERAVCEVLGCGSPIEGIRFADVNLEECVREAAVENGWQTVEEFTELNCADAGVTDLFGLESFTRLRILDLSNNEIQDVSALRGLTQLEQLNLTGNNGIRCVELDSLVSALSSTTIVRPDQCLGEGSNFVWPVEAPNLPMSNPYAAFDVIDNDKYHAGFDLTSQTGNTTVYAATAGEVRVLPKERFTNENHGMGNVIIIDHDRGNGPFTLYAHLASIGVPTREIVISDGDQVAAGDPIGVMGNTGCADDPQPCGVHLHFEVKRWGVLGNLDDDLGVYWGYTPGLPNLYGYINPWPYLDYGLSVSEPKVVAVSADQLVRTGPGGEYSLSLGHVTEGQRFVALRQMGDWYEIDFPSEYGPALGWVQASPVSGNALWAVDDSARGLIGLSVCPTPSSCGGLTPPERLSYVWDEQWIVELERVSAQNGCESTWIRTSLLENATGWVCGDYLNQPVQPLSYPLNDTGITACALSNQFLPCPVAGWPGQDAEFGRDVTHNDDSDGHAGFSFTKLDAEGNPLPADALVWNCVRDNVTGLIWEVKTDDGGLRDADNTYTWYNPDPATNGGSAGMPNGGTCTGGIACDTEGFTEAVNAQGLCGASDWRMPDPRELLSIVSNDRFYPAVDSAFFPNTRLGYWSSSPSAVYATDAWMVSFFDGKAGFGTKERTLTTVRLVRAGK